MSFSVFKALDQSWSVTNTPKARSLSVCLRLFDKVFATECSLKMDFKRSSWHFKINSDTNTYSLCGFCRRCIECNIPDKLNLQQIFPPSPFRNPGTATKVHSGNNPKPKHINTVSLSWSTVFFHAVFCCAFSQLQHNYWRQTCCSEFNHMRVLIAVMHLIFSWKCFTRTLVMLAEKIGVNAPLWPLSFQLFLLNARNPSDHTICSSFFRRCSRRTSLWMKHRLNGKSERGGGEMNGRSQPPSQCTGEMNRT